MTIRQPVHETPGQPAGDDFTRIHGIGPGIASRLHVAGILRYTQLASLSAEEIVAAMGGLIGLTVERVEQQDWAGQARALSEAEFEPLIDDSGVHLHYATFTAELLLDEGNRVRRTRLVNVRAGAEEAWAGWDPDRLVRFLVDQSALVDAQPADEPLTIEAAAPVDEADQPPGGLEIDGVAALHPRTHAQTRILPGDHPFTLTVRLNFSQARLPAGTPVRCHTTVQAKELSSGARLTLADWDEFSPAWDQIELRQDYPGLSYGVYRLEAAALVSQAGEETPSIGPLAAFLEGEILQVF